MPPRPRLDRPDRADRAAESSDWLSLGPASRLVGVDPDTLRRWADEGRIPSYATPGGHRRFDRRDLTAVIRSRPSARARRPLSALGATPARIARAYARSYARDAREARDAGDARATAETAPIAARIDATDREAFRADGRRLLAALMAYLDAGSPVGRNRWEREAGEVVRETGARLAAGGATAEQAVAAFIAARRPFLTELATLGRRRSLDVAALTALYDEAVALLDRLLLELLVAFRSPAGAPARPSEPAARPSEPATQGARS